MIGQKCYHVMMLVGLKKGRLSLLENLSPTSKVRTQSQASCGPEIIPRTGVNVGFKTLNLESGGSTPHGGNIHDI